MNKKSNITFQLNSSQRQQYGLLSEHCSALWYCRVFVAEQQEEQVQQEEGEEENTLYLYHSVQYDGVERVG